MSGHREVETEANRNNPKLKALVEYSFEATDDKDDSVAWVPYRRYTCERVARGAIRQLEVSTGGMCVFRVKV